MLQYLKDISNRTLTENGAVTLRSTGDECLNLFATIGALRNANDGEIAVRFLRAYAENPDLAMKILFYARDIRGGLGERRVFRVILRWMAASEPVSLRVNLSQVAEYGRWDDLLVLLDTAARREVIDLLKAQLQTDMAALEKGEAVSLLAKWLPSVNAHNADTVEQAKALSAAFGMSQAQYRRALSALRREIRIIENNLRERDYTFDYAKQPSRAMFKYRKAFLRNDEARYRAFMQRVEAGEATLHTGALMPYDIVQAAYRANPAERASLNATWNALEDFTDGENALVVADGSGSMYSGQPLAAAVAQSLAIYFAQRNRGAFRNHFITFSQNPQLVALKGADIVEVVRYARTFNEVANTNVQRVFELVLSAAVAKRVPQSELPSTLYFISDMEFDCCTRDASMTNFEYAKRRFARHGYRLPRVVFWNVRSRSRQQPVRMNEQGVALVSGCTPRIFAQVMAGEMDPMRNMLNVLLSERYEVIRAG